MEVCGQSQCFHEGRRGKVEKTTLQNEGHIEKMEKIPDNILMSLNLILDKIPLDSKKLFDR